MQASPQNTNSLVNPGSKQEIVQSQMEMNIHEAMEEPVISEDQTGIRPQSPSSSIDSTPSLETDFVKETEPIDLSTKNNVQTRIREEEMISEDQTGIRPQGQRNHNRDSFDEEGLIECDCLHHKIN